MMVQDNVAGPSRLRGGSAAVGTSIAQPEARDQAAERESGDAQAETGCPASSATVESTAAPSAKRRTSRPASPETELCSSSHNNHAEAPSPRPTTHLDLAKYPTANLLRLLAGLLQQIATANDQLRPEMEEMDVDGQQPSHQRQQTPSHPQSTREGTPMDAEARPQPTPSPTTALFSSSSSATSSRRNSQTAAETPPPRVPAPLEAHLPLFSASKTSLNHPSSLLSFHARHVPSITIEAYLLRILKYCPTTNEVFLGLLVYFDRMSRLGTPAGVGGVNVGGVGGLGKGRGFAIDSYNVHRLVIAGVTVASKFFSDVFYTNSRYAKVGGLPPHELNQLELQFLLLNDFRLVIPAEEMQRYGDRLLEYWESSGEQASAESKASDQAVAIMDRTVKESAPATGGGGSGQTTAAAAAVAPSGDSNGSSNPAQGSGAATPTRQDGDAETGNAQTKAQTAPVTSPSHSSSPVRGRDKERAGSSSSRAFTGNPEIRAPTAVPAGREGDLWSTPRGQSVGTAEG